MESLKTLLAFRPELSEACTVIVNTPISVGVPLIDPELERFNPSGRLPPLRVQV